MNKAGMLWVPLLPLVTGLALADADNARGEDNHHAWRHGLRAVSAPETYPGQAWGHDHQAVSAPEIDPGQAMGALVLLGGAVAIIRGYRRKK